MIHRTRQSTLFPYTTLFRSIMGDPLGTLKLVEPPSSPGKATPRARRVTSRRISYSKTHLVISERAWRLDRKSTRLNSSHLGISYAVFCLKKKRHKTEPKIRH